MKEKKKNFITKAIALITAPRPTWEAIAKERDERGYEFTKYFLPALCFALAGRVFAQTVLGVYVIKDVYKPELAALLPFSLLQGFVVLLMPFALAKPIQLVAKKFTDGVDVESTRRFILFAYLPILALSTFEFIPVLNLSYIFINFYTIYLCIIGAEVMLNILPQHKGIFVFLTVLIVVLYYVFFGFLIHSIAPNPIVTHYLEQILQTDPSGI